MDRAYLLAKSNIYEFAPNDSGEMLSQCASLGSFAYMDTNTTLAFVFIKNFVEKVTTT